MKIKLLDFLGKPTWVEVPDDTQEVSGVILSGDMVLEKPIHKDTSNKRINDFYDGFWTVKRNNFEKLNALEDSYDVFDIMEDEK